MPPPDSSDIDAALVALLLADATLAGLMPDGVWLDEAKAGKQRFILVTLISHEDIPKFGAPQQRCAYEDALYMVKGVELQSAANNSKAAAARIHRLLEDGALTVPGYTFMKMHREERIRRTEVDALDSTIRWSHRGGYYRVQMAPL